MKTINHEQGLGTVAIMAIIAVIGIGGLIAVSQMSDKDMMEDKAMMNDESNMDMDDMDMEEEDDMAGVEVGGAMMVPNLNIVENAMNANNVTTVVAAVSAAGLAETLQSEGPFTVFAPNNAAFAALPAGTVDTLLLPENKDDLVTILTYHVVAGAYTSADLSDGQTLTTVQGGEITIGKKGDQITINGSTMVETADVISSNGVTFVIDGVLMPSEA